MDTTKFALRVDIPEEKIIIVKVNGRPYKTYLDDRGVQRFMPNGVIGNGWNLPHPMCEPNGSKTLVMIDGKFAEALPKFSPVNGPFLISLNDVARAIHTNPELFTLEDVMEFWMMLGYSVSSWCDIFGDEDDRITIENPLWKD